MTEVVEKVEQTVEERQLATQERIEKLLWQLLGQQEALVDQLRILNGSMQRGRY